MDLEEEYGDGEAAVDGAERDPLDEEEPPFALCFLTKRLLSEPKIVKNSRIVVVGASDTGISFIEALLSIGYLNFTNITLVAPGGLPHHHIPEKKTNLKAYSTSYTSEELKKLMLESRIRVLDARMVDIDRSDKNIILNDGNVIPYDNLVLAMGIQDKTLDSLNYASHGVEKAEGISTVQRAKGVLSIDDPYLYRYLQAGSSLMQALTDRRRQTRCVVYGRSLHAYALIQGLLERGVRPQNIVLAIPRIYCHVNDEEDTMVE
jgi:NADPH-dependent 2,4-dienoyl-CoA reductase/sulfur reductase-like enzyme